MSANKSNPIRNGHLKTDDLAFSAYLKMKGHCLIKSDRHKSKSIFTFDVADEDARRLKIEFVNSDFSAFYNELRNLKKLI